MCGSSAPPPPQDPNIGIAAQRSVDLGKDYLDYAKTQGDKQEALGREYLDFAKDQFKISQAKQDEFNKTAQDATNFFTGMAKEDRKRWEPGPSWPLSVCPVGSSVPRAWPWTARAMSTWPIAIRGAC